MDTKVLIKSSLEDVKELFSKFDVDLSVLDVTGRGEAMFNSAFIKSFLNRLNVGDYEFFKEMRDDYLRPTFTFGVSSDEKK